MEIKYEPSVISAVTAGEVAWARESGRQKNNGRIHASHSVLSKVMKKVNLIHLLNRVIPINADVSYVAFNLTRFNIVFLYT